MKEIKGNIWDYYDKGNWIVITTNGTVKVNGEAVMGRGVALQAKQKFPSLPGELGKTLKMAGNQLHTFPHYRIITYPVKHRWEEKASPFLINQGAYQLSMYADSLRLDLVYMVRPGCGNGGLDWKNVKPILEKYLDDRFIIVQN